jgi:hypothetical protein
MVLYKFIEFKAFVEKKCGKPMNFLRSDNGGQYVSHTFEEYLSQNGISWK